MKVFTLEEQIDGLRDMDCAGAHQLAIKNSIAETLGRLRTMRDSLKTFDKVDTDMFAVNLAAIFGEPPVKRRS